jgi:hypothetical protein
MRTMSMVVAAMLLATAPAFANGRDDDYVRRNEKTFVVHRYAFNLAGRTADEVAAVRCEGGQRGMLRKHRTMGDVAAMVFTAFWYTPVHVTAECSRSTSLP